MIQEIEDLPDFLSRHRPEWSCVRWINVAGLSDMGVIHALATKYEIHPLAVEDVLHIPQRARWNPTAARTASGAPVCSFFFACCDWRRKSAQRASFDLFGPQDRPDFSGDPQRRVGSDSPRLATKGSRLRNNDASFLVYSLLDVVVDHCFPILEHYGDRLEDLDALILERTRYNASGDIHQIKRDLLQMRGSPGRCATWSLPCNARHMNA